MSKSFQIILTILVTICIGGVVFLFIKNERAKKSVDYGAKTDVSYVATTTAASLTDTATSSGEADQPALVKADNSSKKEGTHIEHPSSPIDSSFDTKPPQNQSSKEEKALSEDERILAAPDITPEERAEINVFLLRTIEHLSSGNIEEIKTAVGYNFVTAAEKAQFDSLSKKEILSLADFLKGLTQSISDDMSDTQHFSTKIVSNPGKKNMSLVVYEKKDVDGYTLTNYEKLDIEKVNGEWMLGAE
jgi:hypothetical protein